MVNRGHGQRAGADKRKTGHTTSRLCGKMHRNHATQRESEQRKPLRCLGKHEVGRLLHRLRVRTDDDLRAYTRQLVREWREDAFIAEGAG